MQANLAQYEQHLCEKRRGATQATLDVFFRKASLPEASASDTPPTSEELPTSNEPLPGTSTGEFTHATLSPLSSDADDPDVV